MTGGTGSFLTFYAETGLSFFSTVGFSTWKFFTSCTVRSIWTFFASSLGLLTSLVPALLALTDRFALLLASLAAAFLGSYFYLLLSNSFACSVFLVNAFLTTLDALAFAPYTGNGSDIWIASSEFCKLIPPVGCCDARACSNIASKLYFGTRISLAEVSILLS